MTCFIFLLSQVNAGGAKNIQVKQGVSRTQLKIYGRAFLQK